MGSARASTRRSRRSNNIVGVRVHAGHSATIDAAHLVLAVPPPALRAVSFVPSLTSEVASMINELKLGQR